MRRKNLYYAQLGEAISLAQKDIFEYKRISLILFDNIIENLLRTQNYQHLRHLLIIGEITKSDFEKRIESFNRFENIINQSKKLKIIEELEKPILEFCHNTRNNLYHNLFDDERSTEFCILFCSKFLEKNFENLIEIGITSNSLLEEISTYSILAKERVSELNEIVPKLNRLVKNHIFSPQIILSNILSDYLAAFDSFFESNSHESWEEFNQIIKSQYFYEVTRKENLGIEINELIPKFRAKWYDLNDQKVLKIRQQISLLKSLEIEKAFEKFQNLNTKLGQIYIGIMLYYSEQESKE